MQTLVFNRLYWFIPFAVIVLLIGVSLSWNLNEAEAHSNDVILERARLVHDIIASLRYWSASHAENTSQNSSDKNNKKSKYTQTPSLSGRILPGKMAHQFSEILHEKNHILARLTSLSPINPKNAAAPWEAKALKLFQSDSNVKEWSGFYSQGDDRQFRYIAPLQVEKTCLSCHDSQGYQVGGIAGGISVNFLSGELLVSELEQQHHIVMVHLSIGFLLTLMILFGLSRHRNHLLHLQRVLNQQDQLVASRTEQLQQEVFQREEAQERLSRFIESTGEGLLVIDHKGCCTLSNASALKFLGYRQASELIGRRISDFLCPHDDEAGMDQYSRCDDCFIHIPLQTDKSIHDEEHRFRRADGSTFPVSMTVSPITVDGHTLGSVITFSDISERKRNEVDLRKLSRAVEYSPATTMITDANGKIEYVNRRFSESSGYTAMEVIGKSPSIMRSGKTPKETYKSLWYNIKSGKTWQGEILNRKKDGELFWEDISISPVNDDDGNITHFVAVKEDVSEKKLQAEQTWRLANFDSLTGLMNRHYFLSRLEHVLHESKRYDRTFALLFIDLDGFKSVNDSQGHDAGDLLLQESAKRLRESVRESDTVARLGGDEFTIIMPMAVSSNGVEQLTAKLLARLSEPFHIKGQTVAVSASIGIASYPRHGTFSDELLNHADAAMYQAKAAGKNSFSWYIP